MVKQCSRKPKRKKAPKDSAQENPFKSKFELKFYEACPEGKKPAYEATKVNYTLNYTYTPDWEFTKSNGQKFYLETKGLLDADTRRKMKAVKEQNPSLDVRLVFQANNYLYKGSKTRYSEWAEANGFLWHVVGASGVFMPKAWLREASVFTTYKGEGFETKTVKKI